MEKSPTRILERNPKTITVQGNVKRLREHLESILALRQIVLSLTGIEFYPYQETLSNLIIKEVLLDRGEEIPALWSRQSGKTETLVLTMLPLCAYFPRMMQEDFNIGAFAPVQSQAIQVIKKRMKKRFLRVKPFFQKYGLFLDTGESYFSELFVMRDRASDSTGMIRCLSAGKSSNVTGETFNLILTEQTEDLDPIKLQEEIFPMGAAVGGTRVLSGTCKSNIRNSYYYDILTKREITDSFSIVNDLEASKWNPRYALFCLREQERLGIDSIAYQTQYRLNWYLSTTKFMPSREKFFEHSRKMPYKLPKDEETGYIKLPIRAGWDTGKEQDGSVLTWGIGDMEFVHLLGWLEMEGVDYVEQAGTVAQTLDEIGADQVVVDSTGAGDVIVDVLKSELRDIGRRDISVIPVMLTPNLQVHDQLSKLMDSAFQHDRLDFPNQEEAEMLNMMRERRNFCDQFLDLERVWRGGKQKLQHPQGKHDDYPYSTMLMLNAFQFPPPRIILKEATW